MFFLILLVSIIVYLVLPRKKLNLAGKHVMITGGSSGIGKSLAIEAARSGAHISLLARNKDKLENAKAEIKQFLKKDSQQKIITMSVDVCEDASVVESTIKEAADILGAVDVLINCAGYAVCGVFEELSADEFKNMLSVNCLGSIYPTLAVVKSMKERREGHITFVSSVGGQFGIYGYTAYAASKFAIKGLAETLEMELRPYNIGVSIAFPADTDTPGFENENKTKPEETHLISDTGGLHKPQHVARSILEGIKCRNFMISLGFEGWAMTTLTCGAAPWSTWLELFLQVFLMGPLRLVMVIFRFSFNRSILKCREKREAQQRNKDE